MKSLLLTIGLLTFTLISYSQNIYQIRADSVRIYNDCDTAEFILENHTQMVPGYLYNKGRGRTEFRRMRFIDLGLGLIAIGDQDTLNFGNSSLGDQFIRNQFSTAQLADYWIKGRGRVDSTFTLSIYKNNKTEDSVLTTDINGNIKLKLVSGGGGGSNFWAAKGSNIYNTNINNVGIGDSLPSEKLTVNGTVKTAQLKFPTFSSNLTAFITAESADTILRANTNSIYFGYKVGNGNNQSYNSMIFGVNSYINNTTGFANNAFGYYTLRNNTAGYGNNAFGGYALNSNTIGSYNNAFGSSALSSNTTGGQNNAFGRNALNSNATGTGNSAFGDYALGNNTSGSNNSALGIGALTQSTTGFGNVAIGSQAFTPLQSGNSNTAVGYLTGENYANGSYSIFLGSQTDAIAGINNVTVIGNRMLCKVSNVVALGKTNQNVIIGPDQTTAGNIFNTINIDRGDKLQVNGKLWVADTVKMVKYKNNETEDSVLTTDVNGNLKMKAVAAGGDFYSSDGTLTSDRYVNGDNHAIEFNTGSGFFASGEYQGKEYGIGTYNRPLQNSGVRVTWGFNEMQVNDYSIRFAVSQQYPGSYQFHIMSYGTETDQAQIDAAKIGYSSGAFLDTAPVAALDVTAPYNLPAMRLVDGNQGAGRVLTSDANGFATWQPLPAGASSFAATSTSSVSTISDNTTLSSSNSSVFVNNSSNATITLPSAAANSGRIYFVKKISNNGSTVTITGSEPIDGASSYTISAVNKCVQLQSNGTAWYILTVL